MRTKILSGLLLLMTAAIFVVSCTKEQSLNSSPNNYKVDLIPEPLAKAIAQHFSPSMLQNGVSQANRVSTVIVPNRTVTSSTTLVDKNNQPALYIFNYPQDSGYVVVSADVKHEPICAYVDRGNANQNDSVPGALMTWFDKTIENIEILRDGKYDNTARANWAWNDLLNQSDTKSLNDQLKPMPINPPPTDDPCEQGGYYIQRGPFLAATWGQGCSYNDLCPNRSCSIGCWNQNAWTGCVATAMSQVIHYWHPANQYGYNYASMPLASGNVEVQRLMRDCGLPQNVNMNYGCNGSGADGARVPTSLRNNFGFASAQRSSYGSSSYNTVVANLNNSWPVFLEGCATRKRTWLFWWKYSDCHEWVTDGYISTGNNCYGYLYFHMNWGWHETWGGNDHNGWFGFNNWNANLPNQPSNFQYAQDFTFNVHP